MSGTCWGCGDQEERCALMGEHADNYPNQLLSIRSKRFFLVTNDDKPHTIFRCLGRLLQSPFKLKNTICSLKLHFGSKIVDD